MAGKMALYKGDSYIVDIIPEAESAPFPAIYVSRRQNPRLPGKIAAEPGKFLNVKREQFNKSDLNELARLIGRSILDNSDIIKKYI
jgi:hypothetical protein